MPNYALLLRPASFATLPPKLEWDYVLAPAAIAAKRGLPVSTEYPHGVISTQRELTEAECEAFDLRALPQTPATPLRLRWRGDNESWRVVAMFDASKVDVEQLRDEMTPWGTSGPGQQFSSCPSIVKKGKFVFVHQSGGLDV